MRCEQVKASQALDSIHEMMKEAGSSSLTRHLTMMHNWRGRQHVEGLRGKSGSLEWPQPEGSRRGEGDPHIYKLTNIEAIDHWKLSSIAALEWSASGDIESPTSVL